MTARRLLPWLLIAAACDGGRAELLGSEARTIVGGTLDESPERWPGVVALEFGAASCSGTLIAATATRAWVLTAAHCVMFSETALPRARALTFDVVFGRDTSSGSRLAARGGWVHPSFGVDATTYPASVGLDLATAAPDLAIIEVGGVSGTVAAAVIPVLGLAEDQLAPGTMLDLVGYGRTTPNGTADGRRRRVTVPVDGLASTWSRAELVMIDERGDRPGACDGDSGGALIVGSTLAPRLAGVISGGSAVCDGFGLNARVSSAVDDFIEPVLLGRPEAPAGCLACVYEESPPGGACHAELITNLGAKLDFARCLDEGEGPATCRSRFAVGAERYDAYWDCLIAGCEGCSLGSKSFRECYATFDLGGSCDGCIAGTCCQALAACSLDAVCAACQSPGSAVLEDCAGSAAWRRARGCLERSCETECGAELLRLPPLSSPDAGMAPDAQPALDATTSPDAGAGPDVMGAVYDSGVLPPPAGEEGCGCRSTSAELSAPIGSAAWVLSALAFVFRARRRSRGIDGGGPSHCGNVRARPEVRPSSRSRSDHLRRRACRSA